MAYVNATNVNVLCFIGILIILSIGSSLVSLLAPLSHEHINISFTDDQLAPLLHEHMNISFTDHQLQLNNLRRHLPKYINLNISNHEVLHCSFFLGGFGNVIAQYWFSIAFAFYNHMNWKLVAINESFLCPKLNIEYTMNRYLNNKNLFAYYLPKRVNFYDANLNVNKLEKKLIEKYKTNINNKLRFTRLNNLKWANKEGLIEFVRNELFLNKFYKPFTTNAFQKLMNLNIDTLDVEHMVLVHFRCGDILSKKHNPGQYGFFSLSLIDKLLAYWNIAHNIEIYTLYFMINLNADREQDNMYYNECKYLINEILKHMHNNFHYNRFKDIQLISNGTINTDSYLLSNAQYVICGFSSFCYYGAFGNNNAHIACIECGHSSMEDTNIYSIKRDKSWFLDGSTIFKYKLNVTDIIDFIVQHNKYNYTMNHLWMQRKERLIRIYISDYCKFIYFTTLKTASKTTRQIIDTKECGFGVRIFGNKRYHRSCGFEECKPKHYQRMLNHSLLKIIWTRNPIDRFVSNYNFHYTLSQAINIDVESMKQMNRKLFQYLNRITDGNYEETRFLFWIKHIYQAIKQNKKIWEVIIWHIQPIYVSMCSNINTKRKVESVCITPDFVGKVETLTQDIIRLNESNVLNMNINPKILSLKHQTDVKYVTSSVVFKYVEDALLLLCELYWNDFICSHYDLPIECIEQNQNEWHFTPFCVDGTDVATSWLM